MSYYNSTNTSLIKSYLLTYQTDRKGKLLKEILHVIRRGTTGHIGRGVNRFFGPKDWIDWIGLEHGL